MALLLHRWNGGSMPFKGRQKSALNVDSPITMYGDIRPRKSGPLYSQQRDILQSYVESAVRESDVAFHLPTGSGKTLVGLLVAEWRRRKFNERPLYLCPTRWLVNQVAEEANDRYGIRAAAFTGKVGEYDAVDKAEWATGDTIAIATYGALFNARPFFEDPNLIVVDDAHSSENYIADFWTVNVNRGDPEHAALWLALSSVLKGVLSPLDYPKLTDEPKESWDRGWVDLLPMPRFLEIRNAFVAVMDEHVPSIDLRFPWRRIRDHLQACNVFISDRQISIRPIMPPTKTFGPFENANQRLYMSATLGVGGELERITGRRKIMRLRTPSGYDRQAIGRRFFIFPERSISDHNAVRDLTFELIKLSEHALAIVPNDPAAKQFREDIVASLGFEVFTAQDLEKSKKPFVNAPRAVAVLANRYDGIDLPGNECRLLVLDGLPRAVNLQERVLINRMSSVAILADRIRTRLIQAVGRCTRSEEDYSAVIVLGEELAQYFGKAENRALLHPELQAEIEFGLHESTDVPAQSFIDNLKIFLSQEVDAEPWREANDDILARRDGKQQESMGNAEALLTSVGHEVRYLYAIWEENYKQALDECRKVLSQLKRPGLRGWEGFWTYLAGSAAYLATDSGDAALIDVATEYYQVAAKLIPSCRWLSRSNLLGMPGVSPIGGEADPAVMAMIIRLEAEIERLGTQTDHRFAREEKEILEGLLQSDDGKAFERAHLRLGKLLGFDAGQSYAKAAPDPYWLVDETLCFVFEDNAGALESTILDVDKARQAATHENWIRENVAGAEEARVISVLITPAQQADDAALPHLRHVSLWRLGEFRNWAVRALGVIRSLRTTFSGPGNLVWQSDASVAYRNAGIDPDSLLVFFEEHNARDAFTA